MSLRRFQNYRSSHRRCSVIKGALRNFAKFTGKHLCQRLWHRCFPVNFAKFLRTPFLQNTSDRLLLEQFLLENSMFFVRVDSNSENLYTFLLHKQDLETSKNLFKIQNKTPYLVWFRQNLFDAILDQNFSKQESKSLLWVIFRSISWGI